MNGTHMPKLSKKAKSYTAEDMRAVSHNPKWTKEDFAKAKPFAEVFPKLEGTIRRQAAVMK